MPKICNADWNEVWGGRNIAKWDYLSQVIYVVLKSEIGNLEDKIILEAGSGSGRISLRLTKEKARAYLLDNSLGAIRLSKKIFVNAAEKLNIVCASIYQIPYPNRTFDIVWNAGVIEHFIGEEQGLALREMMRVCRRGGLVITINPYANSILHTFGKFIIEKLVRYPFGREIPIRTLKDKISVLDCELKKEEYSIGFILLWVGMFKRLALLPMGNVFYPFLSILNKTFCYFDESFLGSILRKIDLFLSKLFGGYLLVSIFKKR